MPHEVEPVAPVVVPVAPAAIAQPAPRMPRWRYAVAAVAALALIGGVQLAMAPESEALASVPNGSGEILEPRIALAANEVLPYLAERDATRMQAKYPMLRAGDADLDETFPSLRGWTHPVTASEELMPSFPARLFGAERAGIEPRRECGSGHCGVDLDGPRGRPIVAVAPGVVIRVERSESGADGRSGHYVRIQHADGVLTSYMHMDDVASEMQFGAHVEAGQYIGTLGATAVYSAPPHLHFQVEIPNRLATRMDHTNTHYVNPAPFLVRSKIVPALRRRAPRAGS